MIKRWTVILIPHDRGQRRSFRLNNLHALAMIALLLGLTLTAAFFYRRGEIRMAEVERLEARYLQLEVALENQDVPADIEGYLARKEAEILALYELRDRTITDELGRLYDLEREVRIISSLPPRNPGEAAGDPTSDSGQGGTPGDPDAGIVFEDISGMNPPELINGLSNPSADLMLEEMMLRLRSLDSLVSDMYTQRDRLAHTPSVWPTDDLRRRINSHFGRRKDPFTRESRNHSGLDISASYGSPITATATGVVSFSGYHQFLGHLVKINHGYGMETWYGHMSRRLVQMGDAVERGDVIGKVGSTGRSTGPHIHYEVHVNGGRVNPRNYIGQ